MSGKPKKIVCARCGHINPRDTLTCGKCNERLASAEESFEDMMLHGNPLAGSSYTSAPDDDFVARYRARGRRFMWIFAGLSGLTAGFGALLYFSARRAAEGRLALDEFAPHGEMFALALGVCALALFAFLLAKTGEAIGHPFAANFFMALLPPLTPAVMARIGNRFVLLPYIYMIVDAVALIVAWFVFRETPLGMMIVAGLLLPFLIYQVHGCAAGEIGTALGFNYYLVIAWFCVVPMILLTVLANAIGLSVIDLAQTGDTPSAVRETLQAGPLALGEFMNGYSTVAVLTLAWAAFTFVLWVKAIYENLCYPLND
jgi:hypothetical protein